MKSCDYCGKPATTQIPTISGRVCEAHAEEFWTGLLAYAKNQSMSQNHETPGVTAMAKLRRITGAREAVSSPAGTEPMRLAS